MQSSAGLPITYIPIAILRWMEWIYELGIMSTDVYPPIISIYFVEMLFHHTKYLHEIKRQKIIQR